MNLGTDNNEFCAGSLTKNQTASCEISRKTTVEVVAILSLGVALNSEDDLQHARAAIAHILSPTGEFPSRSPHVGGLPSMPSEYALHGEYSQIQGALGGKAANGPFEKIHFAWPEPGTMAGQNGGYSVSIALASKSSWLPGDGLQNEYAVVIDESGKELLWLSPKNLNNGWVEYLLKTGPIQPSGAVVVDPAKLASNAKDGWTLAVVRPAVIPNFPTWEVGGETTFRIQQAMMIEGLQTTLTAVFPDIPLGALVKNKCAVHSILSFVHWAWQYSQTIADIVKDSETDILTVLKKVQANLYSIFISGMGTMLEEVELCEVEGLDMHKVAKNWISLKKFLDAAGLSLHMSNMAWALLFGPNYESTTVDVGAPICGQGTPWSVAGNKIYCGNPFFGLAGVAQFCEGDDGFVLAGADLECVTPSCKSSSTPASQPSQVSFCQVDEALPPTFETIQPWFNAVHMGPSGAPSSVEIESLRVVAVIDGAVVALGAPGELSHGIDQAGLYQKSPIWFGGDLLTLIPVTNAAIALFTTSQDPHVVTHGWGKRQLLPPKGSIEALWVEGRFRTQGSVIVQIGADSWRGMNSWMEDDFGCDCQKQVVLSDWYGGTSCDSKWFTVATAKTNGKGLPVGSDCSAEWIKSSEGSCICEDLDKDGYGQSTCPTLMCTGPQDCDDLNESVHPGASELCGNGQDDNCDGVIDTNCAEMQVTKDVQVKIALPANITGAVCLSIIPQNSVEVPAVISMKSSGGVWSATFPALVPRITEFLIMNMATNDCFGPWKQNLWPASFTTTVNGTVIHHCTNQTVTTCCDPAPEITWRSMLVSLDAKGNATDVGEVDVCPTNSAPLSAGVPFVVSNADVAPGNGLCLHLLYPGDLSVAMSKQGSGVYQSNLYLKSPVEQGQFVVYEALNGCDGWFPGADIYPGEGPVVSVGGTVLTHCGKRYGDPDAQAVYFSLDAAGKVWDIGVQECKSDNPVDANSCNASPNLRNWACWASDYYGVGSCKSEGNWAPAIWYGTNITGMPSPLETNPPPCGNWNATVIDTVTEWSCCPDDGVSTAGLQCNVSVCPQVTCTKNGCVESP